MKKSLLSNRVSVMVVATVLLVGLCGLLLVGCGGDSADRKENEQIQKEEKAETVINLNDYVRIDYLGRDGKGEALLSFRQKELVQTLHKYTVGLYDVRSLERTLTGSGNHNIDVFTIEDKEGSDALSNGDVIEVVWKVNDRGLNLLKKQIPGVAIVWEDFDITVSGLEGVAEIDPFNCDGEAFIDFEWGNGSHVSGEAMMYNWRFLVERVGDSTCGEVEIEVDTLGNAGPWKNGDKIKITILEDDEYLLEEFGVNFTTKTGYVTVDWLEEPTD